MVIYLEMLVVANGLVKALPLPQGVQQATVIVGLVPNGLFVAIAVAYALGAVRIARQGALVQQANAVESLSNVDVLCLDKTGTLTTNKLSSRTSIARRTGRARSRSPLHSGLCWRRRRQATRRPRHSRPPSRARSRSSSRKCRSHPPASGARSHSTDRSGGTYALGAPEMLEPYSRTAGRRSARARTTGPARGCGCCVFCHHPDRTLPARTRATTSILPWPMQPVAVICLSRRAPPRCPRRRSTASSPTGSRPRSFRATTRTP